MKYKGRYIGANHANGLMFGGVNSSFNDTFKDEEVLIGNGIGDIIPCVIGDITDAYEALKDELYNTKPSNIQELCECVFNIVFKYFGDYSNIEKRLDFYPDLDLIGMGEEIGKISNLKGQNAAMCVERAMLSQNLLTSLGIDSTFKISGIKKDNSNEVHAYNLISYKDKHYIFDSTIPTLYNEKINPLICEIPQDVFEKISSKESNIGYSVSIEHFNPLKNTNVTIVYDSDRENTYDLNEQKTR